MSSVYNTLPRREWRTLAPLRSSGVQLSAAESCWASLRLGAVQRWCIDYHFAGASPPTLREFAFSDVQALVGVCGLGLAFYGPRVLVCYMTNEVYEPVYCAVFAGQLRALYGEASGPGILALNAEDEYGVRHMMFGVRTHTVLRAARALPPVPR